MIRNTSFTRNTMQFSRNTGREKPARPSKSSNLTAVRASGPCVGRAECRCGSTGSDLPESTLRHARAGYPVPTRRHRQRSRSHARPNRERRFGERAVFRKPTRFCETRSSRLERTGDPADSQIQMQKRSEILPGFFITLGFTCSTSA